MGRPARPRHSPPLDLPRLVMRRASAVSLLLLAVAGLLTVTHWNVRCALAPLGRLLQAIAGIGGHDARQVQALPPMPTRELESQAEAQRRQLSQQVLTLQEDERARLARDLHDAFGQRLTALRVDAAWLVRQGAGDARLPVDWHAWGDGCGLAASFHTRLPPPPEVAG